jgi:ABC-type sugar transport system ATPase subunit
MSETNILEIEHVNKEFPGVKALRDFTLSVQQGEVHALVGENGAGKSTLIKIISGVYRPDSGRIIFNGNEVSVFNPVEAIRMGISTVHQELRMVEAISVAENIYLGRPVESSTIFGKFIYWKKMNQDAQEYIHSMGINLDVEEKVSNLSVAQKQIVEICKALSRNSQLIIMDEPSATLTEKELDLLFQIIRQLKEKGITVIYISHRLEEIFTIADRVTVMRDGKHIITETVGDISRNKLIAYMVGREIENIYPERNQKDGKVLLEVKGLSRRGVLQDINLTLHEGEILGIAGLVGAGRTELARALFGVDRVDKGQIYIRGEEVKIKDVQDAIRHKIALVPEDRKLQGIIPELSVGTNLTLIGIDKIIRGTFISPKVEKEISSEYIDMLRIQTPHWNHLIKYLSGGNQQKCVLAKWLLVDSDILIFDEPTRGIDVGAKQEIYRLLQELADQGKGIMMISSELPEIIGISHRILVMHDGRITGEVEAEGTSQEEIMGYATL